MTRWPLFARLLAASLMLAAAGVARAETHLPDPGEAAGAAPGGTQRFAARDSLSVADDGNAEARAIVRSLAWEPRAFEVEVGPLDAVDFRRLVRFPSVVDTGDARNDRVALEWYLAGDRRRGPQHAPAVVVVHESGARMTAGRLFARALRSAGLHAFLVHLPHYGERRSGERPSSVEQLVPLVRQAVADVRRARDAVAALPEVDGRYVALQGTSLGGFLAVPAASLDGAFDGVFLMLAGGNLYELIQHGEQDAQRMRQRLAEAGLEGPALRDLLEQIEPTRFAHRLDARTTWLYSAAEDRVVPLAHARALASAAQLDERHHVILRGGHYSAVLMFPFVLEHMVGQMR